MRLESLDITNFRVIKRATLPLPDKLIGIIGPNGSGKSSIVEAIAWALYGHQVARSGKEEIKSSWASATDICEVALSFVLRDDHYRVARRILGRTDRVEVELWRNGSRETTGSTDSQDYLDTLLGLDWRGFLTSFLARQSELNALSDLAPAKRRDHLAGMLGIERLDRAIGRLKSDVKLDQEKGQFIDRQLAGQPVLQERLALLDTTIAGLVTQLAGAVGARDSAAQKSAELTTVFAEHERRREMCSRVESNLRTAIQEAGLLAERRSQAEHELGLLAQARAELEQIEKGLGELAGLRAEHERQNQAKQISLLQADLRQQLAKAISDVTGESDKLTGLRENLDKVRAALTEIPAALDESIQELSGKLEVARDRFAQLKARKEALVSDQSKISGQLNSISDLGLQAVCDRCGRPIGDDREQMVNHFKTELAENRKALEATASQLAEAEKDGRQLKTDLTNLERAKADRQNWTAQQESLGRLIAEADLRKSEKLIESDRIRDRLAGLGEVTFDPKHYIQLTTRLDSLEAAERKGLTLRGRIMAEPSLRLQLEDVSSKIKANEAYVAELRTQMAEIGFDAPMADQARQASLQANHEFEAAREAAIRIQQLLELRQQEQGQVRGQVAEMETLAVELTEVRTKHFYGEKLSRLFGEFRRELIAGIRPRLAEAGSRLMSDMSGGRYQLMELDEEYNIRLFDSGQFYRIDRYSGGETDLANLCLRLAISMTLTESAGMERSLLILDEVFGSQDEGRRELIYQGLAGLKRRFPQILAITHIEELKHRVETVIELVPTGSGWSEVQIDGHTS